MWIGYTTTYFGSCDFHLQLSIKVILDEGSRSKVQWNRTILLDENHKLNPQPLDEGLRPKSDKSNLNLRGAILEEKSIGLNQY